MGTTVMQAPLPTTVGGLCWRITSPAGEHPCALVYWSPDDGGYFWVPTNDREPHTPLAEVGVPVWGY